jgi:predicted DNA binding protein/DNA-binding NarL/FixJ family response regulator
MTDGFDVLLIEDNDGDAVLIEKYLERIEDDFLPRKPVLRRERTLSEGFDVLRDEDIDLLLLDLGLPETGGIETLHKTVDEFEGVPVVVLTGLDDRRTAVRAIQEGAQDYLNKDKIDVEGLGRALRYATERRRRERKAERQRGLRRMVQEVLVGSSTREAIERRFCNRIVEHEPYVYSWIGGPETDDGRGAVVRSSSDDAEDYPSVAWSASDDQTPCPSLRAARSREPVFVSDTREESGDWTEAAEQRGFLSVAAVPILDEDVMYGVLTVYADSAGFFDGVEGEVLVSIVDSLAYSVNAVSKETAILSDTTTEARIDLNAANSHLEPIFADPDTEVDVEVKGTVPTEEGVLQFVDVTGAPPELDDELASQVDGIEVMRDDEDARSYQLRLSEQTPASYLLSLGAVVRSTEVDDNGTSIRVEIPPNTEIGDVVDRLENRFGSATVVMCRGAPTNRELSERRLEFDTDSLTDKQMRALQTAYYRGYFEQPKRNSAEEIADALGVSRSTFLQHLRTAQRKTFGELFGHDSSQ